MDALAECGRPGHRNARLESIPWLAENPWLRRGRAHPDRDVSAGAEAG